MWSTTGLRGSSMARTTAFLMIIGVALVAVGCGGGSGGNTSTTGAATTTTLAPVDHAKGSSDLILQVSTSGGLIPIESKLTYTPEFSLYGDGRVIATGAQIAIYPGPALPSLQTAVLSEAEIQSILHAAVAAGLAKENVDYGKSNVTDMATTVVKLNVDGKSYETQIYALGAEEESSGLTAAQEHARGMVDDFRGRLATLSGFVAQEPTWKTYEYSSLAVYSKVIDTTATTTSTDVAPNQLAWPLADLATLGSDADNGFRKAVVAGQDLNTLSSSLKNATQITQWSSNDKLYNLYFRPLLPDEKS